MHTLLILTSLALALGGSLLCANLLRSVHAWGSRRAVQLTVMGLPVVTLSLPAGVMIHFLFLACFWTVPPVDVALALTLSIAGAFVVSGALVLNVLRAILLPWHLRRQTWEAPAWLQTRIADLLDDMELLYDPHVRVTADTRPWALVAGLLHPYLVVSRGLITLLDEEELDAVLRHELFHLQRGDLWWTTLAGVFHDLTWFLPAARHAYRLLLSEQEVACDDRVLGESRRLALASALGHVWQTASAGPITPRGALAVFGHRHAGHIETRMRRLLDHPGRREAIPSQHLRLPLAGLVGLFTLAQVGATALVMNQLGCGLHHVSTMAMIVFH